MKKIFSIIVCTLATLSLSAQGWPAQYDGVMLQGFYWDSYSDSKWTNLTSQADELSQYFKLIWVPQSGWCNSSTMQMGYSDIWWLDHRSCFGTEAELEEFVSFDDVGRIWRLAFEPPFVEAGLRSGALDAREVAAWRACCSL